ncbi:CsoS2 family carboxysome shell protein [Acidithiobacillus sp.]|uniref:CsoS2 family carboxysome shell protein n=1 Tax=Acidithiobacillus sp. TaxID=1872118 RepID=UPI003D04EF27
MSDAMANNTASPRSARAAALERRQALSHNGGAALGMKASAPARMASSPAAMAAAGATGRSLSRARREALSQGGAAGLAQANAAAHAGIRVVASSAMPAATPVPVETAAAATAQGAASRDGCGCKGKDADEIAEREQAIEAVCAMVDDDPAAVAGPIASAVRKLCQERRRALASQGKAAKPSFTNVSRAPRNGEKSGTMAGLSGRDAARARRQELCRQGRGDQVACRPSGRARPQSATPPAKVEQGTTLSGTTVTGTQVERSAKVTGAEPGSCRAITGTEYIGAEQYGELCAAIPEPAAAKVSVGSTSRGQRVSGVEIGRSVKVTGDEHGACKTVTGTEYLSAEKFASFCATRPVPAPAKVGVAATQAGQRVSGTEVGRSARVTGDESGSCLKLTGSQYYQPEQFGNLCRGASGTPHKVSVMSTLREHPLTGTEIAPGTRVTGAERGACVSVTGTESAGLAQYQACNRKPVPAPEKVGVMRTWHEQPVSGTSVERSAKVTGDEYGGCQPVSGTAYAGPDQYAAFCAPDRQAAARALMASRSGAAGAVMTGIRMGPDSKVTGAARGEGQVLSGTPYAGVDQPAQQGGDGARVNPHPLARGPADVPHVAVAAPEVAAVRGNFSVMTPARSAQGSQISRVTGTAYGAAGRITGPVNLAAGLVSGTPEFRYRDETYAAASVATDPQVPRSRLTGDGREGGFAITGAAWRRNESITGTEGSSTRRNPTLRGDQRGTVVGASQMKDRERPALPISRITGSSGNDAKGSAITYSGGARG